MDEFYFRKTSHVPAFGSWDCNNEEEEEDEDDHLPFPFTQCFESARQAGLLRYSYSEDRDLYDNHLVAPAVIVVPRRRREGKGGPGRNKEGWVMCDYDYDYEYECDAKAAAGAAPSPVVVSHIPTCKPKAVDEDLYKISPDLLRPHPKRKGGWGFFSSCLRPSCVS
ncbi:hypothetical protein ACJIZ3_012345 [Penstemon smallii]|uniref:Uncharacterized protein n=1 Tax=Penstemon smallii TaxID=265156 RepID=A0ABD3UPM2_9LAMI